MTKLTVKEIDLMVWDFFQDKQFEIVDRMETVFAMFGRETVNSYETALQNMIDGYRYIESLDEVKECVKHNFELLHELNRVVTAYEKEMVLD